MTQTATVRAHRVRPWGPIALMAVALLVMAFTAFFHLIQHHISPWPMIAPAVAGFFCAAFVLRDRRLDTDSRLVWAAGMVAVGLCSVALLAVLILHVLPLH